jgi:hypothetical protein
MVYYGFVVHAVSYRSTRYGGTREQNISRFFVGDVGERLEK